MKSILFVMCLTVILYGAVHAFDKSVFMEVGQKCKEDSKASDEDVKKLMEKQIPSSYEAKCMMACIFKAMGIMSQDGKYSVDGNMKAAEKAFPGDESKMKRAKMFAEFCKDKVDAVNDKGDGCERAAAMFSCAMEKAKELGYDKEE